MDAQDSESPPRGHAESRPPRPAAYVALYATPRNGNPFERRRGEANGDGVVRPWVGLAAMMLGGCAGVEFRRDARRPAAKRHPRDPRRHAVAGVFGGLDPLYVTKEAGGVGTPAAVKRLKDAFARGSAEESRAAIMPFLWNVVAKQGQVFGDRGVKNVRSRHQPYKFSYPGYNELLCGYPDPRINKKSTRPTRTSLCWSG